MLPAYLWSSNRYNRALESLPTAEETRIIKLNRSLANLRLGRYDQALEDAGELTAKFQRSEKGFYRAARALYELGKFQESHDALLSLLAVYPNCNEAKEELSRTKLRLTEQHSGYYDFSLMYEGSKLAPPHLDCATYLGPTEIGPSNGRSRGLFVTRDVKVGELLLCEKAFAHCFANTGEGDSASTIKLLLNTHTDRVFLGTQADLVTEIVQKMYRNPSTISAFTSLHHGEYEPAKETEVDGEPVVDRSVMLIFSIMPSNLTKALAFSWIASCLSMSSDAPEHLVRPILIRNRNGRRKATIHAGFSSAPRTSTTAATATHVAASLETCRSYAQRATLPLGRRYISLMLALIPTTHTKRRKRGSKVGASVALVLFASTEKLPRMASQEKEPIF